MTKRAINWKKYVYEFLAIFLSVSLAFGFSKWNEQRNKRETADKLILEIKNGLKLDANDLHDNMIGHTNALKQVNFMRDFILGKKVGQDTIGKYYNTLFYDYISIQNRSAYESLKSKGLEIIKDDSLRLEIISLYDYYFEIIEKLEEDYSAGQYFTNYYKPMGEILYDYMVFDYKGSISEIRSINTLPAKDKSALLLYLDNMAINRTLSAKSYETVLEKVEDLISRLEDLE